MWKKKCRHKLIRKEAKNVQLQKDTQLQKIVGGEDALASAGDKLIDLGF